jgi:hypothetical protein
MDKITPTGILISGAKTHQRLDLSSTMIWQLEKQGLLEGVNIFGKKYYTLESVERFEQRALAGEFARPSRGAAAWPKRKADATVAEEGRAE